MGTAIPNQVIVATQRRSLGGVDTFCANLVGGLRHDGVSATRLLTEDDGSAGPGPSHNGDVPTERLHVSRWATWSQRWEALRRHLESRAPCVYVTNEDAHHSCISPTLSDGVRIIGVVHSDSTWHYDQLATLGASWDAVVAVSQAIASHAQVVDPTLTPRIRIIPYGVPVAERFVPRRRQPDAPLRVVYAGRVQHQQKRVSDLPGVVADTEARGGAIELTVIGDGEDLDRLRARCAPLVARGAVRFVRTLPNGAVLSAFAQADAVVLTSDFEGLPLSLLEAMGQGCVPVVTDIRSGIPDVVVDGVNGYRVPIGDTAAFAERLVQLYRDPARCEQMARSAYDTISCGGYRVQDMVQRYAALCAELLDPAGPVRYTRKRGPPRPPVPLKRQGWVPHAVWRAERWVYERVRRVLPVLDGRWAARSAEAGSRWRRP